MIEHYGGDVRGSRFQHRDGTSQFAIYAGNNDNELVVVVRLGT